METSQTHLPRDLAPRRTVAAEGILSPASACSRRLSWSPGTCGLHAGSPSSSQIPWILRGPHFYSEIAGELDLPRNEPPGWSPRGLHCMLSLLVRGDPATLPPVHGGPSGLGLASSGRRDTVIAERWQLWKLGARLVVLRLSKIKGCSRRPFTRPLSLTFQCEVGSLHGCSPLPGSKPGVDRGNQGLRVRVTGLAGCPLLEVAVSCSGAISEGW